MTDIEHAQAVKDALDKLSLALNRAAAAGLSVEYRELDVSIMGRPREVTFDLNVDRVTHVAGVQHRR